MEIWKVNWITHSHYHNLLSIAINYIENTEIDMGGGIFLNAREDIPSKLLEDYTFHDDIEVLFIEVIFKSSTWGLFGSNHPLSQNDTYYFDNVSRVINVYSNSFDKFVILGDINADDFLHTGDIKNIQKGKTCYKSINYSTIDLILTNSCRNCQNTSTISTGLANVHTMSLTVMKRNTRKEKPSEIV